MEIVFNAADGTTLLAEAVQLGFTSKDREGVDHIRESGPVTGGGWYQLNVVGTVYVPTGQTTQIRGPHGLMDAPEMAPLPGVWGRLRVNGDPSHLPAFSNAITQYFYVPGTGSPGDPGTPGFWSVDGVTPAPDYIANIGLIL